jgi:hypothetical protein
MEPDWMMRFNDQRGTATEHIKEVMRRTKNACSTGKISRCFR